MIKKLLPVLFFGFVVFVALSFFGDFKKTFHLIISFKWQFFPLFLLLSSLNFFFRFMRWQYLLKKIHVKIDIKQSLLIFLSGLAMAVTPLRTGELMKSAMIKKITGDKISHTASLVFVERLTDAIGMLILMSAGLAIFNYGQSVFFLSLLIIVGFIMIVNHEKTSFKIITIISKLPILSRHSEKFISLYSSSKILLGYKSLLPLIFLSTLAWGSTVIGGSLIFFLLGVKFSLLTLLSFSFIFCFSGAIGFLTAIPGGLGISEASVTGLSILLIHIPKDIAVTGVLITRFSTLWFGTVIGIIALTIFYNTDSRR
jgi:glycosyltransferase 2 family protein